MKFYNYINEGRSQKIEQSKALEIIRKNCNQILSNYKKTGRYIYRGLENDTYTLYIDPKKSIRKSANTKNYYTLLIDHIWKEWSDYPKRSQSIICTNNLVTAEGFGSPYIIFPYNNSKIGICPSEDLWISFNNVLNSQTLEDFVFVILGLLDGLNIKYGNIDTNPKDLEMALNEMGNLMRNDEKKLKTVDDIWTKEGFGFGIEGFVEQNKNFADYLGELFDPDKNRFRLTDTKQGIQGNGNELWTDGECIMININNLDMGSISKFIEGI